MPGENVTADELRQLLHYDPETGVLTWLVRRRGGPRGIKVGDVAGRHDVINGYIQIGINRRSYRAHRLAWRWMTGQWPKQIDHINRDGCDNRWSNLRESTQQQNIINRIYPRRVHKLPPGVYPRRGKFYSRIYINGQDRVLGTFATIAEAQEAYAAELVRAHGQFVPAEISAGVI